MRRRRRAGRVGGGGSTAGWWWADGVPPWVMRLRQGGRGRGWGVTRPLVTAVPLPPSSPPNHPLCGLLPDPDRAGPRLANGPSALSPWHRGCGLGLAWPGLGVLLLLLLQSSNSSEDGAPFQPGRLPLALSPHALVCRVPWSASTPPSPSTPTTEPTMPTWGAAPLALTLTPHTLSSITPHPFPAQERHAPPARVGAPGPGAAGAQPGRPGRLPGGAAAVQPLLGAVRLPRQHRQGGGVVVGWWGVAAGTRDVRCGRRGGGSTSLWGPARKK